MKVKYVLTAGVALGVLSGALASSAPALAAD